MLRRDSRTGSAAVCAVLLLAPATQAAAKRPTAIREWRFYGGDQAGSKYSSLLQINRGNGRILQIAGGWKPGEGRLKEFITFPGRFEPRPFMIDGARNLSR